MRKKKVWGDTEKKKKDFFFSFILLGNFAASRKQAIAFAQYEPLNRAKAKKMHLNVNAKIRESHSRAVRSEKCVFHWSRLRRRCWCC
jgi:hypothetical protein